MTRGSILEYLSVSKGKKGWFLDQFIMVTGCHRKEAIRLLCREGQGKVKRKSGRPRRYGHDVDVQVIAILNRHLPAVPPEVQVPDHLSVWNVTTRSLARAVSPSTP